MTQGIVQQLTAADQRAFYDEHGYVVADLLTHDEVERLRAALAEVLARGEGLTKSNADFFVAAGEDGCHHITRVRHPVAQHQAFFDLVSHPKLLDLVETLIGSNIQFVHSKINLKPPATEAAAYPWHQDWPFNPHTNLDMVAVMIPLDDANAQNGCLRVVPGSHRLGPVDHRYGWDFEVADQRLVADTARHALLEVPAGGVTLHHCCLLHSSTENLGARSRNAILFDYRAADNAQLGPATGPSRGMLVRGVQPATIRMIAGSFKVRDAAPPE